MQRAALYIRVSSEEQAIHGLSIAAQTETLDAWAQENKIYVFDHYIDAGISARKKASKRPELHSPSAFVRRLNPPPPRPCACYSHDYVASPPQCEYTNGKPPVRYWSAHTTPARFSVACRNHC